MIVRSEIINPKTETNPFVVGKNLPHAKHDSVSEITLNNDISPIELDISSIELQNIRHPTMQDGVTLVLNQSVLKGMQVIDVPVEQREFSLNNVLINVADAKKSAEFTPVILATLLYLILVAVVI